MFLLHIIVLFLSIAITNRAVTNASGISTNDKTIKMGYFVYESQPPYSIGAIQMAIDKARAGGFLTGYNIRSGNRAILENIKTTLENSVIYYFCTICVGFSLHFGFRCFHFSQIAYNSCNLT